MPNLGFGSNYWSEREVGADPEACQHCSVRHLLYLRLLHSFQVRGGETSIFQQRGVATPAGPGVLRNVGF